MSDLQELQERLDDANDVYKRAMDRMRDLVQAARAAHAEVLVAKTQFEEVCDEVTAFLDELNEFAREWEAHRDRT